MPGFFSLEAAKEAIGEVKAVEETIREAETTAVTALPNVALGHMPVETETLWHKIDHLLYLPKPFVVSVIWKRQRTTVISVM